MKHASLLGLLCLALVAPVVRAQTPAAAGAGRSFAVTAYGAVGDGQTDDAPAFQRALNAAAAAKRAVLQIPAGEYLLKSRVTAELSGDGFVIAGEGQGVSVILCDNTNGALRLHDKLCKAQVTLRDVSFFAVREGAGVAFELASPPRGVRNYRTFLAQNVDIRGHGLPTRFYFTTGIAALNQWRPLFENVIFSGVLDPALNADASDASPFYRPACGIVADGCYAPSFQNCYVWNAHTGYRVVTRGAGDGPEDGCFYRSFAVGCRVGIDVATPESEPQLVIDSCHINCRDVGIRIANRKFVHLVNNLMYCDERQPHTDPAHPYFDIQLTNVFAGVISHNIFQTPSPDNFKAVPPVQHTMILVQGASRSLTISENIFNAKGTALTCAPTASDITVLNNAYPNRHVVPPRSSAAAPRPAPKAP
ncbi:MAG: glycosyl hydrolase family 28-related protein [Verrucomicrobia bacterium]|nr:glycosyl hydrolase family 28-related protein [Verrucomicrobiota bacterium]